MNEVKAEFYERLIRTNKKIIEECEDRILFAQEKLEEIKNEQIILPKL